MHLELSLNLGVIVTQTWYVVPADQMAARPVRRARLASAIYIAL
jgi:hypothetical protein